MPSIRDSKMFNDYILDKSMFHGPIGKYFKKFVMFIIHLTLNELYELFTVDDEKSVDTQKLLDTLRNIVLPINNSANLAFWLMFSVDTEKRMGTIKLFVMLLSVRRQELLAV